MASKGYAADTKVPVERTKVEIERLLTRYGCDQYMSGWSEGTTMIGFRAKGKFVRIRLPLPLREKFRYDTDHDRAVRQRWRALLLILKAKLEVIEIGASTFDAEFLAWTMLPDGRTVGDWIAPQLEAAYTGGKMPLMLPGID